jgi:hypothetical protein
MTFRKSFYVFILFLLTSEFVHAQNSFYLNHGSLKECKFTSDAIYFLSSGNVLDKTDYNGNTIWSRSTGVNAYNLTISDDAIYYLLFQNLVKLDTAGNFIWAKDLSVPECGTSINTSGLTINENHVFVSTNNNISGLPSGMLVYDTAGYLLNQWCDQTGLDNYIQEGFPRVTGGAWFKFYKSGTSVSYTWLVQVDSVGTILPNQIAIDLNGGLSQDVVDVILMPDSTYLSVNRNFSMWMNWSPHDYHIDLTNFTKDGIVLWKRAYYSQIEMLYLGAAGIDSIGNIYLVGDKTNDTTWSQFSLKLDFTGNIIHSSEWFAVPNNLTYQSYSRMEYRNGFLYCPIRQNNISGIMIMDTLMNSSCGLTQSPYSFSTISDAFNNVTWYNYTPVIYTNTPATVGAVQQVPTSANDLCLFLNSSISIVQNDFEVFPNPCKDFFQISSDASIAHIEIYNIMGKLCKQKAISEFPASIDVHELKPGIYFLKFQTDEEALVRKIIIQ